MGGRLLWEDGVCRVVLVEGEEAQAFPGYCRVVWRAHVAEMSALEPSARARLMDVVVAVESVLCEIVQPDKINLASLGNLVPHLHWHVIPRWRDDSHFPAPIWAPAVRPAPHRPPPVAETIASRLAQRLSGTS